MEPQKTYILRCNETFSTRISNGHFVTSLDRPVTTLQRGDVVKLHSASIDSLISKPKEKVVLPEAVDVVFTFTPGFHHNSSQLDATVIRNFTPVYQDAQGTKSANYMQLCATGGFCYPLEETLVQNNANIGNIVIDSKMRKYKKTVQIPKGTYSKDEIIEILNFKINSYSDNVNQQTFGFKESSFLHQTDLHSDEANAYAFDTNTGLASFVNDPNKNSAVFYHFLQGEDWYQSNGNDIVKGLSRELQFNKFYIDHQNVNQYTNEKVPPAFLGGSFCEFISDNNNIDFTCHTPMYDTSTLSSESSTGAAIVGFKLYSASPFLSLSSTTNTPTFPIQSNGAHENFSTFIVPEFFMLNRQGAVLFHSIDAYIAGSTNKSDFFEQLKVDMQSMCIQTKTRRQFIQKSGYTLEKYYEEPVSIEDGIYTSSETGTIDTAFGKELSFVANPFYYAKVQRNASIETPRTEFASVDPNNGVTIDKFIDENNNSIDVLVPSGNSVNLKDFNTKFQQVSTQTKNIQLSDSEEEEALVSSSFDISVNLVSQNNIRNSGFTSLTETFVYSGVSGNYHSSENFTTLSSDNMLSIVYDGPDIPVSSIQVAITDSFTNLPPEKIGNRSIFTFIIEKATSRFE